MVSGVRLEGAQCGGARISVSDVRMSSVDVAGVSLPGRHTPACGGEKVGHSSSYLLLFLRLLLFV